MTINTLNWLRRHRVAVLKGGWSRERPISLKTGLAVEQAFKRLRIPVMSIDVDRNLVKTLHKKKVEFCFLALHGEFGEDGQVQTLLEFFDIPYTGSGPLASALAMDKNLSKKKFVKSGIPTPKWVAMHSSSWNSTSRHPGMSLSRVQSKMDPGQRLAGMTRLMKFPLFVKPFDQGSALGASRVDKPSQLNSALRRCFALSDTAIVEKFVAGRELTVSILGRKALPVIEIIPEHAFYDYHSKYAAGGSRHIVPADLPAKTTRQAQQMSLRAFDALGCSVYGRVDLMLEKNGPLSVLEVNTIPGMTSTSLLPDAAKAAGIEFDELVLRICQLSLKQVRS